MVRNQSANTTSLLALIACTVALILILYIQGALTRNYIGLHYLLADRHGLERASGSQPWDAAMLELHPRLRLWLAQDAFDAGDLSQAETLLQPLLATPDTMRFDAERLLGRIWAQQGRWEDAVAIWRTSGDAHALVEAGLQAQADAQLVQALTAFEAADQVNPSVGKSQLATFLWRTMQEPEEAAALLRAGIDSQPDSNQRRQWLSQLGALYQDQQQWSQAIALYEALHQLMPN
ncbi:MAG: tetratricopeptide repeat protein, partial [Caldilineaceae bacterium]|nr:tetratricopeptide repeat protein [Caldilineaceae bacterium]